jgi:hypothetical protein
MNPPTNDLNPKLIQLKINLVTLKGKLGQLSEKLWNLKIKLEDEQLKNLKLTDDSWNIISFYCDKHPINPGDGKMRTWNKLMQDLKAGGLYNNLDLFDEHSYIRWIFPTYYKGSSGDEHLANKETTETFKNNPILIGRVIESFKTFVGGYYKLKIDVIPGKNYDLDKVTVLINPNQFEQTKKNMGMSGWHNLKRIKRVLHSLMAFGLKNYADAFFECLKEINKDPDVSSHNSYFEQWQEQVDKFHKTFEIFNKQGNYTGPTDG